MRRHDLSAILARSRGPVAGPLGCRLWSGATNDRGYPIATVNGKHRQMRRLVYERDKRRLLAGERVVMGCGERLCLEPAHMHASHRSYAEQ